MREGVDRHDRLRHGQMRVSGAQCARACAHWFGCARRVAWRRRRRPIMPEQRLIPHGRKVVAALCAALAVWRAGMGVVCGGCQQ